MAACPPSSACVSTFWRLHSQTPTVALCRCTWLGDFHSPDPLFCPSANSWLLPRVHNIGHSSTGSQPSQNYGPWCKETKLYF